MESIATLLLSSSHFNNLRKVPPATLNIFLLHQATRLIHHPFPALPGQRIYCAYGYHRLHGETPPAPSSFSPGGLANLGEMLRESDRIQCNQHLSPPLQPGSKRLGIRVAGSAEHQVEALRLACGLAGCGHGVTVLGVEEYAVLQDKLATARDYLDALSAMGSRFLTKPADPLDMVLEL